MTDFQPYITSDGSLGLYNNEFDDIYHSATGALTESLYKFVVPVDYDVLLNHNDIKVLDICYGIGYNTKTFLNYLYNNQKKLLKIKSKKNSPGINHYDTIHTDNIFRRLFRNNDTIHTDKTLDYVFNNISDKYSETIYTNKIFNNIYIKAIDNDKILPFLSPLLKTNIKFTSDNKNLPQKYHQKYFKYKKYQKFKINDKINYLLLEAIINCNSDIIPFSEVEQFIKTDNNYFNSKLSGLFKYLYKQRVLNNPYCRLNSNLHNIYYRYISYRYKKAVNNLKIGNINFQLCIDDARNIVKDEIDSYNLIFLDAFSPDKCPCLWSYEFFKELFRILHEDGMLLTYSTSASVRSAMLESGFYIGNNIDADDKIIGTIAVKNPLLIKHPISEADLGLLKTRAGIFYRDENLTGLNEAIIEAHDFEVKNSNRISTTSYLKQLKKESECMML